MKTKQGVLVTHGGETFNLSARELQLIADSLEIINPDSQEETERARMLYLMFSNLAQCAKKGRC